VKRGSAAGIVAISVATLGVTGGIAYAALPNTNGGNAGTAAPPFRQVVGPEVRGTAARKESIANCDPSETVAGGGYVIAGPSRSRAKSAVPVPIESIPTQATSGAAFPNAWRVVALAPSTFAGKWTLKAYALCG
jgi:hypothetical protein